jgi:nucleotide-binding universal stress UspA family protein
MFKSILVGTDGSETAARAVDLAARLAQAGDDTTLHIVSVGKSPSSAAIGLSQAAPGGTGMTQAAWSEDAIRDLGELLKHVASTVGEGVASVETYARVGDPAEVICELADQVRADLIVVGNRGMQGGRRFLGSVPNNISHHAPCSVLIAQTV